MNMMNDLQCAYLLGRNSDIPLGGVGCHAYFEFNCKAVNREKLAAAWKKVFLLHEELHSRYSGGEITLMEGLPECSVLEYYDISGEELDRRESFISRFREERSHRMLDVEVGCCTGLALIHIADNEELLIFDWELIAGDVRSFINVLEQLACFYEDDGYSPVLTHSSLLLEKRSAAARSGRKKAKEIISADAAGYCTDLELPLKKTPEKLNGCRYLAEDRFVPAGKWSLIKNKAKDLGIRLEVLLMSAFAQAYFRFNETKGILLNVPWFGRSADEWNNVGDFTDIKLVPVSRKDNSSVNARLIALSQEFGRLCGFSGFSAGKTRRLIAASHPECRYIAPIVFSPMLEVPLISSRFERCFGTVSLMLSQTPQVWLDVQSFELDGQLYLSTVYPEELFSSEFVSMLADGYAAEVVRTIAE